MQQLLETWFESNYKKRNNVKKGSNEQCEILLSIDTRLSKNTSKKFFRQFSHVANRACYLMRTDETVSRIAQSLLQRIFLPMINEK